MSDSTRPNRSTGWLRAASHATNASSLEPPWAAGGDHLGSQGGDQAGQVVAQRRTGQRLPAVAARQLEDAIAQPVELQARDDLEAGQHHGFGVVSGLGGDLDDVERRQQRGQRGGPSRELRRYAGGDELGGPLSRRARGPRRRAAPGCLRPAAARRRCNARPARGCRSRSGGPGPASGRPARPGGGPRSASTSGSSPGPGCRAPRPPPRSRASRRPRRATAYARARSAGLRAGLLAQAKHERGAGPVHDLVGHHGGDDLAAQAVLAHLLAVALGQRCREVVLQVAGQVGILGQVGVEQLRVEVDFANRP